MHYHRWQRCGDPLKTKKAPDGAGLLFIEAALIYQEDSCLIWPFGRSSSGHAKVEVKGRLSVAARIVCERVYGPPPTPDHEAAHSCGNGHLGCISPIHLRWATAKENHADKIEHGTHLRGESHGCARLKEADVREIRRLAKGTPQGEIAARFGIAKPTVSAIVTGRLWPHVSDGVTS